MTKQKLNLLTGMAAVTLGVLASQAARAENKLFPTDVLSEGQVDATVDVNTEKTTQNSVVSQRFSEEIELLSVKTGI